MINENNSNLVWSIIRNVEKLIPQYLANEADKLKADGNVAICILEEKGNIYGKIFGTNKIRGREAFKVAWLKASQVWITGINTGDFERQVYNQEIDENEFGIRRPDFIGWEGGQIIEMQNGTKFSVGFSGFLSQSDLEIVIKSIPKETSF